MKKITCIRCKEEKTDDDFYWHDRLSKTLKHKECKTCISEIGKLKRDEKKSELTYAVL